MIDEQLSLNMIILMQNNARGESGEGLLMRYKIFVNVVHSDRSMPAHILADLGNTPAPLIEWS